MCNGMTIRVLKERFGICRLNKDDIIPEWAIKSAFFSITRTSDELSVVCLEDFIPKSIVFEGEWRGIKVEGPLDFSLTGILSSISTILADKGISIFAISTYDTDYILLKENTVEKAVNALTQKGYMII